MTRKEQPGRPREFDHEEALLAIMEVFWRKGYAAASLRDITEATGLGKGSLYAAFGDKEKMYSSALDRYEKIAVAGAEAVLKTGGGARGRITAFLDYPLQSADSEDLRGCFLCNAATDIAATDDKIRAAVARGLRRLAGCIEEVLEGPEASAEARLVLCSYIGLRAMVRAGMKREEIEPARDAAVKAVFGP